MAGPDHAHASPSGAGFTSTPDGEEPLDLPFGEALHALRTAVAAHAIALGAGEELVEDIVVVANELASNAVRHGGGAGRLRLWRAGDLIHCEVSDSGPGIVRGDLGHEPVPPNAYGGRGLWVVRQMSRYVDIRTGPEGATVTAMLAVHP